MKRLYISIILSTFVSFAISQNLKGLLDLSKKGEVCIYDVIVEKNDSNQFIIICDSSIAIRRVILNAKQKKTIKVKDLATPDTTVFKEETKNYTDFRLSTDKKDTLQIFALESSHNYRIEHNEKTWNIIVRKKRGGLATNLYLEDGNLHIGDSCVPLLDTLHVVLRDSFILSKWDNSLSLIKNGEPIKDTLNISVDDSCCYYTKNCITGDSIYYAGDTLSIRLSNKQSFVIVFEKTTDIQRNYWWLLLLLLVVPVYFVIKKHNKSIIQIVSLFKRKQNSNQESGNGSCVNNEPTKESRLEIENSLHSMLDALFNDLPNKVNGLNKNKLFVETENVESILKELSLVEATNKRYLIKKCEEIRQFIKENESILTAKESQDKNSMENRPYYIFFIKVDHSGKESANKPLESSETDWFRDALEYLTKETLDRIRESFIAAAEMAKCNAEAEMYDVIADLKKKAEDAEEKAKKVEESKETEIAEAVKKEQEFHEKETRRLKEDKQKAEERAQMAEQSKEKTVSDAVQKEKESHEREEKRLRDGKEKAETELLHTVRSLEVSQKELKDTRADRDKKMVEIQLLKKAQESFTRTLTSVPFAESYSKQIHNLIELGNQIQAAAYSVLDINMDDPYFIMKALSKYGKMIDCINMENFLTDVNMISKANFVFNDSSLASFKENNKDIDSIMRSYFFNQYLEKYINAIMVLNESMSGLKLLLPEVQSKVGVFDNYRNDILSLARKLKVSVLFVKVGDMAGENIDLKAKTIDIEIGKPGQILEIENCIVYLIDNRKPQTKIKVIIKK